MLIRVRANHHSDGRLLQEERVDGGSARSGGKVSGGPGTKRVVRYSAYLYRFCLAYLTARREQRCQSASRPHP
ncbi:hypothetical protein J6590_063792 [Homalodisca vitripennis]|nr:hypothetical protein J6590_063792 [Homalodisca vitripennis]